MVSLQAFSVPLVEVQVARNHHKATTILTSKSKKSPTVKIDRRRFKDRVKTRLRLLVGSSVASSLLLQWTLVRVIKPNNRSQVSRRTKNSKVWRGLWDSSHRELMHRIHQALKRKIRGMIYRMWEYKIPVNEQIELRRYTRSLPRANSILINCYWIQPKGLLEVRDNQAKDR